MEIKFILSPSYRWRGKKEMEKIEEMKKECKEKKKEKLISVRKKGTEDEKW